MFVLSRGWIHRPHERHLAAIGVRYIRIRKQMSSVVGKQNDLACADGTRGIVQFVLSYHPGVCTTEDHGLN